MRVEIVAIRAAPSVGGAFFATNRRPRAILGGAEMWRRRESQQPYLARFLHSALACDSIKSTPPTFAGYKAVTILSKGREARCRIIVAPRRCAHRVKPAIINGITADSVPPVIIARLNRWIIARFRMAFVR